MDIKNITKTYFTPKGKNIFTADINLLNIKEKLPVDVYQLNYSDGTGFFLTRVDDYIRTDEIIFGDINEKVDKFYYSYKKGSKAMGILLTGLKGSGKTMFIRQLSVKCLNDDIPVIIVGNGYTGNRFTQFMDSLGECIVVFDEFGKHYDKKDQESLLSFVDGTSNTKRLLLFSENSEYVISEYFINRPSRIWYHLKFKGLSEEVIKEYCVFNGIEEITKDILDIATSNSNNVSFDVLSSIKDEYLKFDKQIKVKEFIKDMNIGAVDQRSFKIFKVFSLAQGFVFCEKEIENSIVSFTDNYTYINTKFSVLHNTPFMTDTEKTYICSMGMANIKNLTIAIDKAKEYYTKIVSSTKKPSYKDFENCSNSCDDYTTETNEKNIDNVLSAFNFSYDVREKELIHVDENLFAIRKGTFLLFLTEITYNLDEGVNISILKKLI